MNEDLCLEVSNVSKSFNKNKVLNNVNLKIKKGTVHALIGENGAGKSTLMKIIVGEYKRDSGTIIHRGKEVKYDKISESQKNGIAMIHQELNPLPKMKIFENIFLGQEYENILLNDKKMIEETKKILNEYNINFLPTAKVEELSIAQMQMLEIIKAVRKNANLIIMDEPTSSLSEEETIKLFKIINYLKHKGTSIIYISHRLDEILKLADEITVLRDGNYIDCLNAKNVNKEKLVELMVGRSIDNIYPYKKREIKEVVLEVKNLNKKNKFKNISFSLRKGEILGISGLVGAGRSEIVNSIFGINSLDSGEVYIDGKKVKISNPTDAIKNRIAFVSEDRKSYGLVLCRSIKENIILANLYKSNEIFINEKEEQENVDSLQKDLLIKYFSSNQQVGLLSGGNQQKVVLAKWLLTKPKILILDEPTRGIDVGAKFEIYKLILKLAEEGISIIMISSELPEVMGMSDRIMVLSNGEITAQYYKDDIDSLKVNQNDLLKSALERV